MNKLLSKTFMWMALGLLITFVTGFVVSNYPVMLENVFGSWGYVGFVVVEIILVIVLSSKIMKLKPQTAKIMFLVYSFVSGLTFASIFVFYKINTILMIFLITAIIYALLAFVGYTTKIDLTKFGPYFFIILIAIIITSIINIFMQNSMLELILSVICVVIFLIITAYDVQRIKRLEDTNLPKENLAIYGALDLYLDFINIFLNLIQIFGHSDN